MFGLKRGGTAQDRRISALEARVTELEAALAERVTTEEGRRFERRLEALALLHEYRIDQIYARLLDVLPELARGGKLDWLASAGDGVDASLPLAPGRLAPPLTRHGFRLTLGAAVERTDAVEILSDRRGIAVFGPYRRLPQGRYRIACALEAAEEAAAQDGAGQGDVDILFEIVDATRDAPLGAASATVAPAAPAVEIETSARLSNPLEFRIHQRGGGAVRIVGLEIERL